MTWLLDPGPRRKQKPPQVIYSFRLLKSVANRSKSSGDNVNALFQRLVSTPSARLVYCAPKYCHVTPLLRELHWLPVRLRLDFKILLVTFKILHGVAPSYLKDLVSVLPDSRYQLRRNNNGILLERPRLRTKKTLGDRALSMAAPLLWNSFPLPIGQETSIDSFKRSVKTYQFKKAFS